MFWKLYYSLVRLPVDNYFPRFLVRLCCIFDKDASDEILADAYAKATAVKATAGKPVRYNSVTRYSTVNDFVDGNAWSGIIADFMMTAVRVDYVTNSQS